MVDLGFPWGPFGSTRYRKMRGYNGNPIYVPPYVPPTPNPSIYLVDSLAEIGPERGLAALVPRMVHSGYKRRSAYTGSCWRIRRESDNAESDVGFNGLLPDVAAVATFCGASVGRLIRIYDQMEYIVSKTVSSINTGTDVLTSTSHGIVDGTRVRIRATTTQPGGTDATTNYFFGSTGTSTGTLHTGQANARDNTNLVDITSSGAGTITLDVYGDWLFIDNAQQPMIYDGAAVTTKDGAYGPFFDNTSATVQGGALPNSHLISGSNHLALAVWCAPEDLTDTGMVAMSQVGTSTRTGIYPTINASTGAVDFRTFSDNFTSSNTLTTSDRCVLLQGVDVTPSPTYPLNYGVLASRAVESNFLTPTPVETDELVGTININTNCSIGRRGSSSDDFDGHIFDTMYFDQNLRDATGSEDYLEDYFDGYTTNLGLVSKLLEVWQ